MRSALVFCVAAVVLCTACTEESTTPIDLDATTTTAPPVTSAPPLPDDDPNAEARAQLIELAEEECRKDPTREFGVVIIADQNGVEVNRYEHPCDEVDLDDADAGGDE